MKYQLFIFSIYSLLTFEEPNLQIKPTIKLRWKVTYVSS